MAAMVATDRMLPGPYTVSASWASTGAGARSGVTSAPAASRRFSSSSPTTTPVRWARCMTPTVSAPRVRAITVSTHRTVGTAGRAIRRVLETGTSTPVSSTDPALNARRASSAVATVPTVSPTPAPSCVHPAVGAAPSSPRPSCHRPARTSSPVRATNTPTSTGSTHRDSRTPRSAASSTPTSAAEATSTRLPTVSPGANAATKWAKAATETAAVNTKSSRSAAEATTPALGPNFVPAMW